jgi:pyruvyl transferase EpsO
VSDPSTQPGQPAPAAAHAPRRATAHHGTLVQELRSTLLTTLDGLLRGTSATALIDFPAHSNVGDSAIWLGALAALRALGAPAPAYTCDAATYDREALARAIGDGTILFTGGGSFGDLWERHLRLRERVVADFPRHRIIQLPESVHFQHAVSLARSRTVWNAHPRVTILVRDTASLAFVQREFRTPVQLAPDLACALGSLERPTTPPACELLWLKRDDKEDGFPRHRPAHAVDWIAEPRTPLIAWTDALRDASTRRDWLRPLARRVLSASYASLATQRLARGVALLASARVLVTDRLHGHILATQLGIPHVVLDNSYGKLHHYVATWTHASPIVRTAQTPDEAAHLARTLLSDPHA